MNSHPELKLDWCSYKAAKYAVEHWHYSKSLPTPPLVKIGVWEDGTFIGIVLYSRGVTQYIGKPYNLPQTAICELTRIALTQHKVAVSRVIAISLIMMRRQCPGMKLVISYADPSEGHNGSIYQAAGWLYVGQGPHTPRYLAPDGKMWHSRMCSATGYKKVYGRSRKVWKTSECQRIDELGKHKYLMPLDGETKQRLLPLSKPYPKRAKDSSEPSSLRLEEGGAAPTRTLQYLAPRLANGT